MTGPATIGESCVDRYLPPISRDTPGGNALNVAAGLAAAGLPTAYVGAVGDDEEGRFVLAQGRARGIDMRHVAVAPGRTGRTTITVTPEGDRVFDSEVLGVSATFRPSDEAVEFLKTRSWVHATGPGEIVEALESVAAAGVRLSYDVYHPPRTERFHALAPLLEVAFLSAPGLERRRGGRPGPRRSTPRSALGGRRARQGRVPDARGRHRLRAARRARQGRRHARRGGRADRRRHRSAAHRRPAAGRARAGGRAAAAACEHIGAWPPSSTADRSPPLPRSRRLAAMPATASRIDDCLSIREGRLWIEECDAVELARRFGTPVYAVSEDQLRRNARRIAAAFADRWPEGPVTLLPSLKANLSLALRRILNSEGLGCDTFGPGELHAALASGIDPALISVNGSAKDAALVQRAVEAGARVTLDSRGEIDLVSEAARAAGRTAKVRLRLRPDYDGLDMPSDFDASVSIREGAHRYKPGIPLEQAADVARKALADDGIELAGVMAHLGRHSADPEVWRAMAGSFAAAIGRLSAELDGWRPAEIDVGGGYAAPRDPTGPGDPAPPIEDVAAAITSGLRDGLAAAGIDPAGIRLEAEPGRALYADCGIHLATVRNLKHQAAPVAMRWVETDTTEMFMADLLIEHARFGVIDASQADSPTTETADVVGMSCGFDVLVPDARLPKVRTGDVLAFLDTGAYQDACASNFNGLPRPGTVLVSGASAEWIKRPETVEDVFARDVVPERLA